MLNGGYAGYTIYIIDALACVKQIEVDFHFARPFDQKRGFNSDPRADGQYERQPPDHVRDEKTHILGRQSRRDFLA